MLTRARLAGGSGADRYGLRAAAGSALSTFGGLAATLLSLALLALAAVLAVVFAATLMLVLTLATLLCGLTAAAWRVQRRAALQAAARPRGLEQATAVGGHAWVTYDWNRSRG